MSNPSGPDQPEDGPEGSDTSDVHGSENPETPESDDARPADPATEVIEPHADHEPATEVMSTAQPHTESAPGAEQGERRFTAPSGFDAGTTQKIDTPAEPATEVFSSPGVAGQQKPVAPQVIPPRGDAPGPPQQRGSWGWVVAVVLVIAALVAIAVLGTVLLTRDSKPGASQEEMVRNTIEEFDTAIQSGDLAKLRSITCGSKRDSYVRYDDKTWEEIHERVAAAKQYPVVASIDQVVINGDHAEANVTAFMAYAPQTRSTRSFDLEFRDEQWKICQAPQ
ncbi:Rv0361 family membrane protein [Mycolicibacterium sp. XJ1904]